MTKTRVYKYQVEKLMDELSKMAGSNKQYHNLRKESDMHGRMHWRVDYYGLNGFRKSFVGDTLADAQEHFLAEVDESLWREEQQAKWEAENS